MMSSSGHVMTLANSIIGVGILAMPFCFQKCGIILSIVLIILNNLITRISCHYLIKSSLLTRRKSFEFLGFHAFGSSGKLLVELCIIGYLIGSCITYFVVVGDVGPQIVSKIFTLNGSDGLRTWVMVLVTLFCILPLGMLKNIDSLSAVCTASIGFYFCLMVKIILESERHILANDWQNKIVYWEPSGILQCLPIFSMALSCQMQLFEVLESVNNQSLEKLNGIIKEATWMCTLVYIAVGFFGYVAFCTQTFSGNILINFTPSFGSDVIKIGFVLSVAFSFPLVIFPCRASIYSLLYRRGHADTTGYIPEVRFKTITAFIVIGSLCIALLIPSIELVIGLVGSTIGIAICIIFPAACFRKISKKDSTERTLAHAIIVGGCCLMILGTYANLSAIDEQRSGAVHNVISESVPKTVTPLTMFENKFEKPAKESLKENLYQNVSLDIIPLPNDSKSQEEKPKPVVEPKAKISPPLPVDEVEPIAIKPTEKVQTEKKKILVEPTPLLAKPQAAAVITEAPQNSNGIAKEAIKNEEKIAAEEQQQQKEGENKEQLVKAQNELIKTKELLERKVDELKEELAKQNKLTQDLVVEKLGEVVEKVEEIERQVHEESKKEEDQKLKETPQNSLPKASVLGILTENNYYKGNSTKVAEKNLVVVEPVPEVLNEVVKKKSPDVIVAQDARAPLPLPLLINASQSDVKNSVAMNNKQPQAVDTIIETAKQAADIPKTPDSDKKTLENNIANVLKSKLPVDEVESAVKAANNSASLKLPSPPKEEANEKENIEAIRRDILEVNKDHSDSITTIKPLREKRSASNVDLSNIETKLQQENCLSEVKEESLLAHSGLDIKIQGLGRDLKSAKDDDDD
ncbi:putative sodium-coupled neutral amino acid transporter 10 [Eupeodes corollae]|uniref:putative sodium-coupled neutral amino acid transporter 10 n=1 Tax=Eupeodes corollae TaxID=290404 RepID=UPI002490759D|nr:putative sodium-coupled neutral amino acid transporter 10 [Eupeodes corollae]XP_055919124.1 putative sodium-coupled neutral amino acid transporter 10 [Eupeodes corollae]XP_055919125.1 putative sodium-coupled neutral amino acid transporter 10 [Eupeodes corollae]XP_055919126.1 putative sodium-coupled neutral amino acid transporter 10 [Eupeodes corollae]XP_055919128.1 putative sodium-coupled neutral amino acid transporter 10 [Eupeodes corollae]